MAAGQGFKTFTTGEVLTAGDVNGYLMQGINVFTNATARDAAITAPAEGQFAFTKDNNSLWYYDGAAWVASGATGDIEGVTAGVGISGGGTSGTVTVTNSMATAIDAKGDLVPGTGADTFARLAVGANGTILTADSAEATGMKWAAAAGGGSGLTLISTQTAADVASITFDNVFNSTYLSYLVTYSGVRGMSTQTNDLYFNFRYAGPTTQTFTNYMISGANSAGTAINLGSTTLGAALIARNLGDSTYLVGGQMFIRQVGNANNLGLATGQTVDPYGEEILNYGIIAGNSRTYTGFIISASAANISGTFTVYGLAKS